MPVMAVSLPPATSSTPATASGSIPETEAQLSMAPSTGASAPASPAKSGSLAPQEKEEMPVIETAVEKPATSKRRRDRKSKPKPKPKKKETAKCVGYYVDALDKKMLWGEARIIQCNLSTQKIKVHFVGWSKNYDLWTDPMSITAHGRYAPRTKDESVKSWDGDMHLFEDMLGTIEESTFTPVPVPAEDELQVALTQAPAKKKAGEKKRATSDRKVFTEKKASGEKKAPSEKKISSAKVATARQPERSAAKRKAAAIINEKPSSESTPVITKPAASNAKRTAGVSKGKENQEKNQEPSRNTKRQKREVPQKSTAAVPTTGKSRSGKKKKKAPTHDELPLFRDLELEDGTVVDFSKQREEARVQREAMQSFLDRCALVWKKQLSAVSVQ